MKTLDTIAGKTYVVTSPNGCTVTDETDLTLGTVEAGQQKVFVATGAKMQADDDSARITATFNSAPAKLMALGLLGGGSTNALPEGYIAAEFLESTGTQYATVPFAFYASKNTVLIETLHYSTSGEEYRKEGYQNRAIQGVYDNRMFFVQANSYGKAAGEVKMNAWNLHRTQFSGYTFTFFFADGTTFSAELQGQAYAFNYKLFRSDNNTSWLWNGRKKYWKSFIDGELKFNLVPAVDTHGVPCFYDKLSGSSFSSQGAPFIVGFTLTQASKLGTLPATGGSLTISLPSNWQEDEAVVNALATAEANGWVLTYQTYEADASTASTFALRRIYVRKTQDENGQYIDADGTRWHVEWCAGMIGAEPTDHGYEPFRSVDAAVAYWELEPWVDPEAEELLTNSTTNEHE